MGIIQIDSHVRRLRYLFFKLSPFERLTILAKYGLIRPDDAEKIPGDFFGRIFDRAVAEGGADYIAGDHWIKELDKESDRPRPDNIQ